MSTYRVGHIKHNPDDNETALRTIFEDDPSNPQMARLAWLVSNPTIGARNAFTSEVEAWVDLYVPAPPQPLIVTEETTSEGTATNG